MKVDLGTYLQEKGSPLAGHVPHLMTQANRYRVDPRLIVAIAGAESSFGKQQQGHNAWGIGPHEKYASWNEGITRAAQLLGKHYVGAGLRTVKAIGAKWAPVGAGNDPTNLNSNWYRNVSAIYTALGGNPDKVNTDWRKGASPAAVAKLPSQNQGALTAPPPPADLLEQQAFAGLSEIGRGGSPTRSLKALVDAQMAAVAAEGAAATTTHAVEQPTPTVPNSEAPEPSQSKPLKAGGGWAGSYALAKGLADIGIGLGLQSTSEKRDRQKTKTGGTSDHWSGSSSAYAFDISNGVKTPQMDAAAAEIARRLGVKYDGKSELVLTVNRNGYRIQVLYRTQVGGDHTDHIHVGVKRIG